MKKLLKRLLPKWCINFGKTVISSFKLIPEYNYWFWKDVRKNSWFSNERRDLADLLIISHVLEKGITMPQRRFGFGYARVRFLIERCKECIKSYT